MCWGHSLYLVWFPDVTPLRHPVDPVYLSSCIAGSISPSTSGRVARGRVALVAAARWETPYAPEWLAYHRAIGFDHVYLTCNDDDPAALWEAVLPFTAGSDPFVHLHPPPLARAARPHGASRPGSGPPLPSLDTHPGPDEFVHLPATHDIERLLDAAETTWGAIHLNRIAFGNSGFRTRPPGRHPAHLCPPPARRSPR